MTDIPRQRERTDSPPTVQAGEDAPDEVLGPVAAFAAAAAMDPITLKSALYNGKALSSPSRVIAEAELGDKDENRARALSVLAYLFETGADRWLEYDPGTHNAIHDGIGDVESSIARTWRVNVYLGRVCLLELDGQATIPPQATNPFGTAA